MTTKRRPLKRILRTRITAEAIEAYQAGDERRLHRALGLKPWDASPLDAGVLEPFPHDPSLCMAQSWATIRELRLLLEAANEKKDP